MVGDKFLLHSVRQWKTPSWKTNISEHDKIHKSLLRIFFVYHKLGWDIEINKQIHFG